MITFADISEFQDTFDPKAYIAGGHDAIICRVHNGYRADGKMPSRMRQIRAAPFRLAGWYLYLAVDRDPATQAREFIGVIGKLADNEFPILDHEEGTGNQAWRAQAALAELDKWAGFPATLYSSRSFLTDRLGGPGSWHRPLWIAAYLNSYQPTMTAFPPGATFWQYTDRGSFPGLTGRVDGSIYPGTTPELAAAVRTSPKAPAAPAPAAEDIHTVAMADGRLAAFAEHGGQVWHRWQQKTAPHPWSAWQQLGRLP